MIENRCPPLNLKGFSNNQGRLIRGRRRECSLETTR
jgi:hypothetical protein